MILPSDLRPELRWLSSGFLLMLFSGFGQTYYIALFAGQLKSEFSLSDGQFGSLYTVGTLASAALLAFVGRVADTVSTRWLGAAVIAGLGITAAAMSAVASPLMLVFVLFGLRFFGQGMLTHTAMTAMGRWFNARRGRAVSIAALGLPASEGLMPPLAVASIAFIGWRQTWLAGAALLLLIALPLFVLLLRQERHPAMAEMQTGAAAGTVDRHQWSRNEVLRSPIFFCLLAIVLAAPFIMTAVFFNQVTLSDVKGWPLAWFAASFPLLAITHVLAALSAGWIIDRIGARRLLSTFLLPLGCACLLLAYFEHVYTLPVAMVLIGLTLGGASTTSGALWPELFGTAHLGAIRAMTTAAIVLSTAVAPGLVGWALDAGISLQAQLVVMGAWCFAAGLGTLSLLPRLNRLAETGE